MEISLLADHPHEVSKIAKWYFDEWGDSTPGITQEIVLEKVREKSINRNKIPMTIVAYIDGELVGALELKIRENKHYPEYENWIGGVFITPSHRGHGIANQLLDKAKKLAIELGVQRLYLQCESFNIPLYLKNGFTVLHQAQHHGIEITIMVWEASSHIGT